MKKRIVLLLLSAAFISQSIFAAGTWQRTYTAPPGAPFTTASGFVMYKLDEASLRDQFFALPVGSAGATVFAVPQADGSFRDFRIWQTPMMPAPLAAKYPGIRTFTGVAVDDPSVTAKFDFTLFGFHAMIFDGENTSFVNPYDNSGSGYYTVHYKRDEVKPAVSSFPCQASRPEPLIDEPAVDVIQHSAQKTFNGHQLRTYRLALSCSHQYAQAATSILYPLVSQVLSTMTTTMNRINGVYERELSVTMQFVANEDTLIFNWETGGPNGNDTFSAINGATTAGSCLSVNQYICDQRIGNANYDIGHVFTSGAGGLSQIGVVCQSLTKAMSVTGQPHPTGDGFDIDYVAHEMGHEFGADHTFNNNSDNSCGANRVPDCAYEPGSGSTVMAYAGICSPDDIQPHSDDYFHTKSLLQIQHFITTMGDACAVKTTTGNKLVAIAPFSAMYNIPYKTPFELISPTAVDSVGSTSVTYCWEEWDLTSVPERFVNTHQVGPIFRSYAPKTSEVRVFPRDSMVLAGVLSDAGKENKQGEKAPDTARMLTFKLAVRNMYNGKGAFTVPDDSISLNVVNTGRGFRVTSQQDSGANYIGLTRHEITWDVAGTDGGVVNTPNVEIYMSADGGHTWPYHIGTFPNNGSATVPLPNPDSTISHARLKVKGSGNVFFNVNRYDFMLTHSDGTDTLINISPVPARTVLRISTGNKGLQQFAIYNALGQRVFASQVDGIYDLPVSTWARGMYVITMYDNRKSRTVKKFVVE